MELDDRRMNLIIDENYDILKYMMSTRNIEEKDMGMNLVSLTAFRIFYGNEYLDTIINAYQNSTLERVEKCNQIGSKNFQDVTKQIGGYTRTYNINVSRDKKVLINILEDKISLLKDRDISETKTLENFLHEMNHVIKSQNRKVIYKNDRTLAKIRMGVRGSIVDYQDNPKFVNEYLEEGLNQLQTEKMMKIIAYLSMLAIENKCAKRYLEKLTPKILTHTSTSYLGTKNALVYLYEDKRFKTEYDRGCLDGNIENIFDNFDYHTIPGGFNELSKAIDIYTSSGLKAVEQLDTVAKLSLQYTNSKRR